MGRKSSAKSPRTPLPPPSTDSASSSSLLVVGVVALVALAGGFTYWRSSQLPSATTGAPALPAEVPPPASALLGPHPQPNLPPLPFNTEPPARPPEFVRAAYRFAAEHPEVMGYVPCYCGCEHSGHRGGEDCFVTARNDKGDVTEWEPHGAT